MHTSHSIDRRTALTQIAGWAAVATLPKRAPAAEENSPRRTGLGLVLYTCGIRRKFMQAMNPQVDLYEPLTFLKHCHELGAGGIQAALGTLDANRIRVVRDYAEQHEMFIDGIVSPPRNEMDLSRFAAEIRTAAEVGVQAVRTVVMPGRRYEQFKTLGEFREAAAQAQRMLERAAPLVEKYRVRLAVENHKDQRIDERLALYQKLSSEFIGACVDTGNSFALLDDPYGAIEALAPHAFTVHLKDQAVKSCEDGFLLADIPLGAGCFDLKRMVETLQRARPKIRMLLELITRDPLRIPCLSESYWTTMPTVPASDLARALRIVGAHPAENLPQVSSLPLAEQLALEDVHIGTSLNFARAKLGL